jgi:hypothetical protein
MKQEFRYPFFIFGRIINEKDFRRPGFIRAVCG